MTMLRGIAGSLLLLGLCGCILAQTAEAQRHGEMEVEMREGGPAPTQDTGLVATLSQFWADLADTLWPHARYWVVWLRPKLNFALPVIGCLVVLLLACLGRRPLPFIRGMLVMPLLALGAISVWHYMTFYPVLTPDYFDEYEFYHYYIGAKYAPEVGYTQMYNASIVADAEDGLDYDKVVIRDLTYGLDPESPGVKITHEPGKELNPYRNVTEVLEDKEAIKALFSDERWAEFVKDIHFFQRQLGHARWSGILRDKGYNATPVWGMTGGLLSNAAPTSETGKTIPPGLQTIALLDPLLIALALIAVGWAYGPTSAALVALFFGANYLTMHSPTMKQAFLRVDWATLVVLGAALVRKRWYGLAGVVLAYAALARMFPLIFVVGLAARGLLALIRTRRVQREYLVFAIAFAGSAIVLVAASIVYAGGLDVWRGFFQKIAFHNEDISTWRVGFKYIFMQVYDLAEPGIGWFNYKAQLQTYMHEHALAWWSIQGAVLLATLYLVQYLRDDEAITFSFVPVFFLVAPTHYYYVMLIIPFLFFAGRHTHSLNAVGMAYMFAFSAAGWHYDALRKWQFPHAYDMSTLVFVLVLYMMLTAYLNGRVEAIEARFAQRPAAPRETSPAAT